MLLDGRTRRNNMIIGTLNFQRSQNYGALLVTYSLMTYLRSLGLDVHPIDYWPEHHISMYPEQNEPYDIFIRKYLEPFLADSKKEFDLIIYGADTIWEHYKDFGYDDTYWGSDRLKAKRKITYAASGTMKNFSKDSDRLFVKYLPLFDKLSVREDVLAEYLNDLTGVEIDHVCDPTFLLKKDDYSRIMSDRIIDGDYAVIYNRQLGAKLFEVAETVNNKTGHRTVVLKGDGCLYESNGECIRKDMGPSEFLSLVYYSSYVLAASFHAVAFSIIFEKQFNTIMKSGGERVESLLRKLGLEERKIEHSREIDLLQKIDYSKLYELSEYIEYSKNWIRENIYREQL